MDRITEDVLRDMGACHEGRLLFRYHFPDGVPVTPESLNIAWHLLDKDIVDWFLAELGLDPDDAKVEDVLRELKDR